MNARLIKETRVLLPIFACMMPLMVLPGILEPAEGLGYFALGVACVVMAGSTFGTEFQHHTISLLLSQPIARSVIWREKMLVLGAGLAASLAVVLGCLAVSGAGVGHVEWVPLALIPLCAFCGAPFWTLSLRQSIAGMVAAVGVPCGILAMYALVNELLGRTEPAALAVAIVSLLLVYCAVVYWQGYAKFKRLEAVDTPARELGLPAGVEAMLVAPLTKVSSRFRGPYATLLKKEFRVQQISFLLAGVFVLIGVAGFCLAKRYAELATGVVGGDIFIYALILPLVAGAISVAEERGWGIAEWHLTLPPSALKQWSAKILVTLTTSLVLGLVLPGAMFFVADQVFGQPRQSTWLPPAYAILSWVLSQMLMTSVAVYAASFSKTTLQAILAGLVILIASGVLGLAAVMVREVGPAPFRWAGHPRVVADLLVPLLPVALCIMLWLMQWFAWSNFRRNGPRPLRLAAQLTVVFLVLWLFVWISHSAVFFLRNG